VQEDHAAYGIKPNPRHVDPPHPGVFVLDGDGVVTHKRFHESYRERETGSGLIAQALGIFTEPAAPAAGAAGAAQARAWLDSPTFVWFQRLALTVELTIAPGFHVYAAPVPEGLVPLSVDVAPIEGLQVEPASWPASRRFEMPELGDGLLVHEGTVRGTLPLTFTAAPGGGDHLIGITLRYQACDDSSCRMPSSLRLQVLVRETALVGRSLPSPTTWEEPWPSGASASS
jgi:DsbC/DsbD-like thiol-disulfide interchange protein